MTALDANISCELRKGCSDCWARNLCGGTCYTAAHLLYGDILQIDIIECTLNKFIIECNLKMLFILMENRISIDLLQEFLR